MDSAVSGAAAVKLLVAGSRELDHDDAAFALRDELKATFGPYCAGVEIISGMARGMDKIAWFVGRDLGLPVVEMPADWDKHGKRAGYVRNAEMVKLADEVWVWWDYSSPGTKSTIDLTLAAKKPLRVYRAS